MLICRDCNCLLTLFGCIKKGSANEFADKLAKQADRKFNKVTQLTNVIKKVQRSATYRRAFTEKYQDVLLKFQKANMIDIDDFSQTSDTMSDFYD